MSKDTKITSNIERPTSNIELRERRVTPGQTAQDVRSSRFFGLVNRKERWGLSWKGRMFVLVLLIGLGISLVYGIYPFLAVTQRANSDVLVVEGWIPDFAIRAAAAEFATHNYVRAFTTGGPVRGMGSYTNDYNTSASVGASRLKAAGVPNVQMVPSRVMDRDRTYAAAIALRDWFGANDFHPRAINVVTEDVHARRSRLLFQEAFGPGVKIGIIAVPNPDYNAKYWWRYSEGVKEVVSEGAAYMYAKLLFYPSDPKRSFPNH